MPAAGRPAEDPRGRRRDPRARRLDRAPERAVAEDEDAVHVVVPSVCWRGRPGSGGSGHEKAAVTVVVPRPLEPPFPGGPGSSCRTRRLEPQGPCLPAGPPELLLGLVREGSAVHAANHTHNGRVMQPLLGACGGRPRVVDDRRLPLRRWSRSHGPHRPSQERQVQGRSHPFEQGSGGLAGRAGLGLPGAGDREEIQRAHRDLEFEPQLAPASDRVDEPRHPFVTPALEDRHDRPGLPAGRFGDTAVLSLDDAECVSRCPVVPEPAGRARSRERRGGVWPDAASVRSFREVERLARVAACERDCGAHLVHRRLRLDLGPVRDAVGARLQLVADVRTAEAVDLGSTHHCRDIRVALRGLFDLGQRPVPVADPEGQLGGVAEHVWPVTHPQVAQQLDAFARDPIRESRVLPCRNVAEVDARADPRHDQAVRLARRDRADEGHDGLAHPAEVGEGGTSGDEDLDRLAGQVEALRGRQDVIGRLDGIGVATEQQVRPRQLGGEADVLRRLEQIPVFVTGGLQQGRRFRSATGEVDGDRIARDRGHQCRTVGRLARQLERPGHVPDRLLDEPGVEAGFTGGGLELGFLAWVGRDLECLLQEPRGLEERTERPGTFRCASERHPCLCGDRGTLRSVRLSLVRRHVVLGQRTGDALVVERLEVARGGDVHPPPIALGEGPVGDLADEALDEPVLALFGRARIRLEREHLAADECPEPPGHLVRRQSTDGCQRVHAECLADHRRCLEERSIRGVQPVQSRGDQRVQRRGHRQLREVAGRAIDAVLERDEALAQEHPNRLDGIQRDPLRSLENALGDRLREPGNQSAEQLAHEVGPERLEHERREVAPPGTPVAPSVEELGAGQRDDVDRPFARPVEDVVDEVEQSVVGPLEVLEDEHHDTQLGDPLEEDAPGGEQRFAVGSFVGVARLQTEQLGQARLHPAAFGLVGDPLGERGGQLRPGRRRILPLGDPGPAPDHLGEGPEADPFAVGRGATLVPVDDLGHAVHVLLEFPDEPALADPALADDRDQPRAPFGTGCDVEVLEHPQLRPPPDERRLELYVPPGSAAASHHPERAVGRHRRGLALECLVARGLEGDRLRRRLVGRLADEDGAGRCHGLEARRGVDQVARDHPLVRRPEGHRRLAGEHAGAQQELRADLLPETFHRDDEVERAADRALGVVLERGRRAPDRHDRIADELLDGPAVRADDLGGGLEVAIQQLTDGLGIAGFGQGRESDEVGEQDGDEAALGGGCVADVAGGRGRRDAQVRAALAAELHAGRVRRSARRTRGREGCAALPAEFPAGFVRGPACRAVQSSPPCVSREYPWPVAWGSTRMARGPGQAGPRRRCYTFGRAPSATPLAPKALPWPSRHRCRRRRRDRDDPGQQWDRASFDGRRWRRRGDPCGPDDSDPGRRGQGVAVSRSTAGRPGSRTR